MLMNWQTIGGSDVGPILFNHPRHAGEVYLRIVDGFDDGADTWFAEVGRALEPVVRRRVADELGCEIVKPDTIYVEDWGRASPDGIIEMMQEGWECKVRFNLQGYGEEGSDQVPHHELLQCMWYMHVTGLPRWRLTVQPTFTERLRHYFIGYLPELGARMENKLKAWWDRHVVTRTPPALPPARLDDRWPGRIEKGEPELASPAANDAMLRLRWVRRLEAKLKPLRTELEAALKTELAGRGSIVGEAGVVTWTRGAPRRSTDWQQLAQSYRLLVSTLLPDRPDLKEQAAALEEAAIIEKPGPRVLRVPRDWTSVKKSLREG